MNTLKDYAKHRLLNDTIKAIRSKVDGLCILILDPHSVKVVSSVCRMYDIIASKISATEQLALSRKRFPDYNAIYLLSPTSKSVQKLLADFKDPALPQYGVVHLCFLSPLPSDLLKLIGTCRELVPRIKTLKELNIDYLLEEPEVFTFGSSPSLSVYNKEAQLSAMAERIMTVCCTLMENPYVQYCKKSKLCKELAKELQQKVESFVKKAGKNAQFRSPRGCVVIVDRLFDMSAPVMHDYCYEVILHDLISISKEGAIDTKNLTKQWDKEENKSTDSIVILGQNDPLWGTYRYLHIGEVFKQIASGMKDAARSNEQLNAEGDLDKLQDAVARMPNYKEVVASYQLHAKLTTETSKLYSGMNHTELIRLEQEIVCAVDEKGVELDPKAIANAVGKLAEFFPDIAEENRLRIYLLYLANYEVPRKDIEQFAERLKDEKHRDILWKVCQLDCRPSDSSYPRRRTPRVDTADFEVFRQRVEQSQMASVMYVPKMAKVAVQAAGKALSLSEFPFLSDVPKNYGRKEAPKAAGMSIKKGVLTTSLFSNEKSSEEFWSQPRLIIFVIGGISYQELTVLFRLQQERKINCPLTVGSECIVDPKGYIASFDSLERDYKLK